MRTRTRVLAAALVCVAGCEERALPVTGSTPGPTRVVPFRLASAGAEEGQHLATDLAGNLFVAGSFSQALDFNPGPLTAALTPAGGTDVFLAAYDASGASRWAARLGGAGDDQAWKVLPLLGGTVLVSGFVGEGARCGTTALGHAGGRDAFVAEWSATGTCLRAIRVGGRGADEARGVAYDLTTGDVIVVGTFADTVNFAVTGGRTEAVSAGAGDIFAARYAPDGALRWVRTIGTAGDDGATAVVQDVNGDLYITAVVSGSVDADPGPGVATTPALGGRDVLVWSLTAAGGFRWASVLGGADADEPAVGGLALDGDGTLVVTGSFRGVADLAPGPAQSLVTSAGNDDVFVVRLRQSDGGFVTGTAFGGAGVDAPHGLAVDAATGASTVTGRFEATMTIGTGTARVVVTAGATSGATDPFVVRLARDGAPVWAVPLRTTGNAAPSASRATGAAPGANGAVWVTGRYFGQLDVGADAAGSRVRLASGGGADGFVAALSVLTGAPIVR